MRISWRPKVLEYSIRELVPVAKALESKGKKVVYLNIGDPLKFDFETPEHIRQALKKATDKGYNYYSLSQGDRELLEAIAEKERRINNVSISPDRIIVTVGVSEAINFVMATFVEEGDNVLLPSPTYPLYVNFTKFYGGIPIFYKLSEDNKWQPDIEDIKSKVNEKTKLLVLINPNNPTGAVYSRKILEDILDIAAKYNIAIVSDEIYDMITFEGKFYSTASLAKDVLVIGLNGFSKTYLMTGWRLGYVYVYDPTNSIGEDVFNAILKLATNRLCAATPVQRAAIQALKGSQEHIKEIIRKIKSRRDKVIKMISEMDCLEAVSPQGAFYIFPRITCKGSWKDDRDFAYKLLIEENVLVVPGSGFYALDEEHFRIVILPPDEILEEAFERIRRFINKNRL